MNAAKKICNIFGILLALLLSAGMIAMLIVSPAALTVVSVTEPSAAGELITNIDISQIVTVEHEDPKVEALIQTLYTSDASKEVAQLYMSDVYSYLSDENHEAVLTEQMLQQIAHEHMDELVQLVQESNILPEHDQQQVREEIQTLVETEADTILAELPDVQQIADDVIGDNAQRKSLVKLVTQKGELERVVYIALAILAVLIFLFRLPGFKGLRWLATDLYIAGAVLVLQCLAVTLGGEFVAGLFSQNVIGMLIAPLVDALSGGMILRTAIVLGAAVLLTVAYCVIRKLRKKV